MPKITALILLLALVAVACADADVTSTTLGPANGDTPPMTDGPTGPVFIDETELIVAESFPMQLFLVVRGNLPTPCHEAQWEVVETSEGVFEVALFSVSTGEDCIQVLEPVEVNVPLGTSEGGPIEVLVNGEDVASTDL